MKRTLLALAIALVACGVALAQPSRPPPKGCAWEKLTDRDAGLEAWVLRCDYGFRKISFHTKGHALFMRYSDGEDSPVIEVFDLGAGESPEAGIRRIFRERTKDEELARHCVLHLERGRTPRGVRRYTFVADAALAKKLDAKAVPGDIPDPPCGDWGYAPDGIQYFESQDGARKVMFVRVGQDEPLFDEATLRLTPNK